MQDEKEAVSIQMQIKMSKGLSAKSDFTQTPNGVARCFNLSRGAKALWTEMFSYCFDGGDVFPGIERMSINLGVSKATIMRDTKELVDIGLVTVEHRSFNRTNMYTLYDANDIGLPNGSRTYIESHPEEFDGYKWLGKIDEKVVSPCNHVVAPVQPELDEAVKQTTTIKQKKEKETGTKKKKEKRGIAALPPLKSNDSTTKTTQRPQLRNGPSTVPPKTRQYFSMPEKRKHSPSPIYLPITEKKQDTTKYALRKYLEKGAWPIMSCQTRKDHACGDNYGDAECPFCDYIFKSEGEIFEIGERCRKCNAIVTSADT